MRQGQQNRRGRGRSGRKPQSPLTRNFESNGPNVKIRGTASHIAEKYMTLARDALSFGDIIAAESFFQHAEHYNRIIMSAHQPAPQERTNGGPRHAGNDRGVSGVAYERDDDDYDLDDDDQMIDTPPNGRSNYGAGEQPQPYRRQANGHTDAAPAGDNEDQSARSSEPLSPPNKSPRATSPSGRGRGRRPQTGTKPAKANGTSAHGGDEPSGEVIK
jgi:hypothetical protein